MTRVRVHTVTFEHLLKCYSDVDYLVNTVVIGKNRSNIFQYTGIVFENVFSLGPQSTTLMWYKCCITVFQEFFTYVPEKPRAIRRTRNFTYPERSWSRKKRINEVSVYLYWNGCYNLGKKYGLKRFRFDWLQSMFQNLAKRHVFVLFSRNGFVLKGQRGENLKTTFQ